jgi:tetratricopeptide (TPR) repeat protein
MSPIRSLFQQSHCIALNCCLYIRSKGAVDLDRIEWIKSTLQKFPYWQKGHSEIARLYLRVGQIEKAYFAAQTFTILAGTEHWESPYLLGVCFLRSGDLQKAERTLAAALEKHPSIYELREEYAATLIGQGAYERAIPIIEAIPEQERSSELVAALDACKLSMRSQDVSLES